VRRVKRHARRGMVGVGVAFLANCICWGAFLATRPRLSSDQLERIEHELRSSAPRAIAERQAEVMGGTPAMELYQASSSPGLLLGVAIEDAGFRLAERLPTAVLPVLEFFWGSAPRRSWYRAGALFVGSSLYWAAMGGAVALGIAVVSERRARQQGNGAAEACKEGGI
jgi:hypothetical protein